MRVLGTIPRMATLRLQTLIERLHGLHPRDIVLPTVQAILADGALDDGELRPYVGVRADRYARRLVHRSRWFDVMVLTWAPGQFTPVHNHAGHLGWVRLVRGQIAEDCYRLAPGSAVPDAATTNAVAERTGRVALEATSAGIVSTIGAIATVDRQRAIHRIGNPAGPNGDVAVTLHVYSLPHEACLAFDVAARTCETRQLVFDSLAG